MNKDLKYILKRVIVGVLVGVILFSLKSCNVKALTIDEVQWDISTNQYIRSIHRSSGTYYNYNSSTWGNYTTANYRSIFEYGAYVLNPVCDDDYCLVENKSYIMSFFVNSNNTAFNTNFASYLSSLDTFHIRASYLNTSNAKTYITLQQSSFNFYSVNQVTPTSYEISIIFTMPKLPSNTNSSHFIDIDFWFVAQNEQELLYTGTSGVATGISNFSIENATPSNVISYINHIKTYQQNNLIIQSQNGTTEAINDLNDTMKDDNIDNSESNSFFNNFQDNTHGLSGIITAPLSVIQSLVNVSPTSCQDLSINYQGKTITLPCGKIFWGHDGFSSLNDFYNLVVGGMFAYLIIKNLFLMIEQLKNPDNDKVEVLDL